jgi:hypothetical protein
MRSAVKNRWRSYCRCRAGLSLIPRGRATSRMELRGALEELSGR